VTEPMEDFDVLQYGDNVPETLGLSTPSPAPLHPYLFQINQIAAAAKHLQAAATSRSEKTDRLCLQIAHQVWQEMLLSPLGDPDDDDDDDDYGDPPDFESRITGGLNQT
jgi:hypothetical protein